MRLDTRDYECMGYRCLRRGSKVSACVMTSQPGEWMYLRGSDPPVAILPWDEESKRDIDSGLGWRLATEVKQLVTSNGLLRDVQDNTLRPFHFSVRRNASGPHTE